ncbi:hypothetical protein BLA29_006775 [Euroglyphus maynei]|uniref:Uncharacterized protein n=1 Tax=Euroglyphus maynei TaxID=6958 RepID=A0A1Y3BD49_EURMA|nr:hypothetical protein BLA29_006775 [Euroglyphus maynei]
MNRLNRWLRYLFNRRHYQQHFTTGKTLRLNRLRSYGWQQFQRQHQHMIHCIMFSSNDVWNNVLFVGLVANIPLNIMIPNITDNNIIHYYSYGFNIT